VLLILVNFIGKTANGAENWIDLKFFQLQPSEVAKIFLIFSFATFFSSKIGKIKWQDILVSVLMLLPPLVLILTEPDLGTAMVVVFIYFVILIFSKPSKLQLVAIFVSLTIGFSIVTLAYLNIKPFGSMFKDYQRKRIEVFINPNLDPYGRGYNVKQAQITIGSGGIMGKGLGRGTQSQLQFLPEAHTDFIFAGIAESFGFLGCIVLLFLYCYFIVRIIAIAQLALDNFGMLVAFGIAAMFLFQVLENVGMNVGLLPVTGIPLPFLSSGGTSLLVSFLSVGIVESIFIRHRKISF
jgi:rod shape determining protein RodA